MADDPTVEARAIARRLGITVGWFSRTFKTEMGMSLLEYRNRVRLDRVDALLGRGGSKLLNVARAAGFRSYSQFHRAFRDVRHMTPRKFLRSRPQ